MTSNLKIRFTAQGRRDLRAILRHTLETWGKDQRQVYADRISATLEELAAFPELGPARDDLYPGLRSRLVGEHIIYYEVGNRNIVVNRILHVRMDPSRHLKP